MQRLFAHDAFATHDPATSSKPSRHEQTAAPPTMEQTERSPAHGFGEQVSLMGTTGGHANSASAPMTKSARLTGRYRGSRGTR